MIANRAVWMLLVVPVSDMCFILLGEAGAWFEVRVEARQAAQQAAAVSCILHVQ
jgi:hypothetical protein